MSIEQKRPYSLLRVRIFLTAVAVAYVCLAGYLYYVSKIISYGFFAFSGFIIAIASQILNLALFEYQERRRKADLLAEQKAKESIHPIK